MSLPNNTPAPSGAEPQSDHAQGAKSLRRLLALSVVIITATVVYTLSGRESAPAARPQLQPVSKSPLADIRPPAPEALRDPAAPSAAGNSDTPVAATHSPASVGGARANAPSKMSGLQAGSGPIFLLLHTGADLSYHKLSVQYDTDGVTRREATPLACRAAPFARGRGVCLAMPDAGVMAFTAELFDANFQRTRTLSLNGFPSRTRVSADGRYAAITVFVSGHSYATAGFSTETQIIDAATGDAVVANLEQMEVWSKGVRWQSPDANFWGVTFAKNSDRFYATLGTGGSAYLVEGSIRENRITVLREGVECPSLSPDNTRVAFKSRVPGPGLPKWRVHVLDLATMADVPLAETDTVDEQVGWLDNERVTYTKPDAARVTSLNVWAVPADGTGAPELLLREAGYATTIRP